MVHWDVVVVDDSDISAFKRFNWRLCDKRRWQVWKKQYEWERKIKIEKKRATVAKVMGISKKDDFDIETNFKREKNRNKCI